MTRRDLLAIFAFLLLGFLPDARAAQSYRLVVMTYSTESGHMLALSSYAASFELGTYATVRDCESAGEQALKGFRSTVQANGSRLLPAYVCEVVK